MFRILQRHRQHATIEDFYQAARREIATISPKTEYQTVHALAELREVQVLDRRAGGHRQEPTMEPPRRHLVCPARGRVRDLFVGFLGPDLSTTHGGAKCLAT